MDVFLGNINCQNWSEKKENLNKPLNMKDYKIINELTHKEQQAYVVS